MGPFLPYWAFLWAHCTYLNKNYNSYTGFVDHLSGLWYCLFVGCLTSQQHAGVSQRRICSDNPETEVGEQTFHLTQSQYSDTGQTSPNADPITPGVLQGNHWNASFYVTGITQPGKNPGASGNRILSLPFSRRTP